MFDSFEPRFSGEDEPEEFPEDIRRELAKLGLEDQRFSPLDYSERLADYIGATIEIRAVRDAHAIRGLGQRLRMALTIDRLTGNPYAPEEAAILLRYARRLADLSYYPENHAFLVCISESLKPPNRERIAREMARPSPKVRLLGRPGRFWRRNYFLSSISDLAIYRQLSHIACGHLPEPAEASEQRSSAPLRRLVEQPPVRDGSVAELAEYYDREADRRALWLLRLATPRFS